MKETLFDEKKNKEKNGSIRGAQLTVCKREESLDKGLPGKRIWRFMYRKGLRLKIYVFACISRVIFSTSPDVVRVT